MEETLLIIVVYFALSLWAFFGIWKDLEKEYESFGKLLRKERILCRTFAILFWPIYVIPGFVMVVKALLKQLYDSFVE